METFSNIFICPKKIGGILKHESINMKCSKYNISGGKRSDLSS